MSLVRRGNAAAFEVLVGRYEARLLAFCRHLGFTIHRMVDDPAVMEAKLVL